VLLLPYEQSSIVLSAVILCHNVSNTWIKNHIENMRKSRRNSAISKSSSFQAMNKSQEMAWEMISNNIVTFLLGPAGTAKTYVATAYAIEAVKKQQYNNLIVTRPLVEASESLGWLPGEITNKVAPYMEPIANNANKIGKGNINIITKPIAYMRGITFEDNIYILDEAQNCTRSQLKLYLTRLGRGAKVIICGDNDQSDIANSGLENIVQDLEKIDGIGIFYFTADDIVRHSLVNIMVDRFSKRDSAKPRKTHK
jgi:phosphate starvation-inducible PhoH-like protein